MSLGSQPTILQVLPALESGGVERGTLEIGRAIVGAGYRSLVMSAGGCLVPVLEEEGTQHCNRPVGRKSLRSLRLIGPLRQFLMDESVDLVHARSRVPAWLVWRALQGMPAGRRPAFVTTFHGFYSPGRYSSVMTRGDRVIAVSSSIADYIGLHYPECPPERRRIIHRGVDSAEFPRGYKPSGAWQREFLHTLPAHARDCALITLPGRITRWKGQLDFLDVIEALIQRGHRVHGLIVGGTEKRRQRYETEVRQAIVQRGLDAHLSWLGQRSDLREIMAMSFAVLSLSLDPEAFGRVSLEALSLGRPVVAYDHGGVAEQMAQLLPAGAVAPGQPVQVATRLAEWLAAGPPEPVLSSNFTLQAMQDQTLAVYRELIEAHNRQH